MGRSYIFSSFCLDTVDCRLFRDGAHVPLAPKAFDLLLLVIERRGRLVTKDEIAATLWPDVSVTDGALTQLVYEVRGALDDQAEAPAYLETVPRRGYRFIAGVQEQLRSSAVSVLPTSHVALTASMRAGVRETPSIEAHRAFTEGRMKLEQMDLSLVDGAVADFERALAADPRYALPYVGLAHARFWRFEASRPKNQRNHTELLTAIADAHRAIDLDPDLAEAYAALAVMLVSANRPAEAVAAGRRAVVLEPGNWRGRCRLALAAWGRESTSAWEHVLELYPDFAYAHYGIAMVSVARSDFETAEQWLRRGCPLQDRGDALDWRFPGRGLHWLLGLVRLAAGDTTEAATEFERELTSDDAGVYAAEFNINAYDGLGFVRLREGDFTGACDMFLQAIGIAPDHARSWLGMAEAHRRAERLSGRDAAMVRAERAIEELRKTGRHVEAAQCLAVAHVVAGHSDRVPETLDRGLSETGPGFAGWTIPVEPLFASLAPDPSFQKLLRRLADRAR